MTEFPRTLKHITLWLVLGTLVFLAVQAWQRQQQQSQFSSQGGVIELRRAPDGHFHWPGRVNGVAVPYRIGPRRAGDLPTCYAATDKAARLLHWHAEKDLADMCRDAWRWQQSQNQ